MGLESGTLSQVPYLLCTILLYRDQLFEIQVNIQI